MEGLVFSNLKPETLTWEQALRLFQLRCKSQNLSPATLELYGFSLGAFRAFLASQGDPKPSEVQSHHLRAYLEACKARMASETVDARYRQVRTLFRFLLRDGLIFKDPTEAVERPKKERRLVRPFTVEQFRATLDRIKGKSPLGLRDRALLLLLADSGLRLSEALSLTIANLDLGSNTALVLGKGGKERKVCWGEATRRTLLAWLRVRPGAKDTDPVFCDRFGFPLKRGQVAHRLKAYTKGAGIASHRLSAHALRHMFAVEFLKGGGDVITLQRLLGHSTLEMTRRYLNLTEQEVLEKARSIGVIDRLGVLPGERRRAVLR